MERLQSLNVPVIAHLKKGVFIWITRIIDSKVYYLNIAGREKAESCDRFEQEWSGVALAIENIDHAGEPDYREKRYREIKENALKYLVAGVFGVLLAILIYFSWTNDNSLSLLPKLLLVLINAFGCYFSYVLIRQEKHQSDALSNKFCKIGKHIDCKKVTSSKYSKLFGVISWAELGAVYFSFALLWVAIAPLNDGWLPPLWWLSLFVLPFTLWSLTTQAFVIRKWCLFCCSVAFLLWANAGVLAVSHPRSAIISGPDAAMAALLFMACLTVVFEASKTVGSKARSHAQQRETSKIKYNIPTIQTQLSETAYTIEKTGFVWGNSESSNDIGLYVSASCSHCGTAVKEFKRLTEIYPDFCYRLIFAVSSDNFDDKANVIIRHLINLYKSMNKNEFFDMLNVWYTMLKKDIETLQKNFPVPFEYDCKPEMDALYQFNQQSKAGYTPAVFLSGRLLSQLYSYKDLSGIARAVNAEK